LPPASTPGSGPCKAARTWTSHTPRWRRTSKATAANAALALSESTLPRTGKATKWSHSWATSRRSPAPSAPTTSAIGPR